MVLIQEKCPNCGVSIEVSVYSHIDNGIITCPYCKSHSIREAKHSILGAEVEGKLKLMEKKAEIRLSNSRDEERKNSEQIRASFKYGLILMGISFLSLFVLGISKYVSEYVLDSTTVKVTEKSSYFNGENYKIVEEQLRDMGFTNVNLKKIEDLKIGLLKSDGEVEQVMIGGDGKFEEGDRFKPNSKVKIIYHTFRRSNQ